MRACKYSKLHDYIKELIFIRQFFNIFTAKIEPPLFYSFYFLGDPVARLQGISSSILFVKGSTSTIPMSFRIGSFSDYMRLIRGNLFFAELYSFLSAVHSGMPKNFDNEI